MAPEITASIIAGSASIIAAIIATRRRDRSPSQNSSNQQGNLVNQQVFAPGEVLPNQYPTTSRESRRGHLVLWMESYLGIAILSTAIGFFGRFRFYDDLSFEAFSVFAVIILVVNIFLFRKAPIRVVSMLLIIAITFLLIISVNALIMDRVLYYSDEWLALWTVSTTIVFIGTLVLWLIFRKRK